MTFDELIHALSTRLNLSDLSANHEGMVRLVFEGDIYVDIEPEADHDELHIYSSLGPQTDDVNTLNALLAANLFGKATGGAVIALDDFLREILLSRTFTLSTLDFEAFLTALENFVNYAELWRNRLASGDLARAEDQASAAPPPEMMIRA